MNCKSCGKNNGLEGREFCRNCFLRSVEHRIKKELRLIKKDSIILQVDESAASKVLEQVISQVFENSKRTIKKVAKPVENAFVPVTLDEINAEFLKSILFRKTSGKKGERLKFPLARVTSEECEEYCRIKGIKHEPRNKDEIQKLLGEIEKTYSGTHFSLKSTREKLDEIRKK
ncbi:MAG: hypothetical protein AABX51_07250 [Nanoarchaeota archaeon]